MAVNMICPVRGRSRDRTPVVAKGTLPVEVHRRARAPKLEPAKFDSEFEDKALSHKAKQEKERNDEKKKMKEKETDVPEGQ